MVLYYIGVIGSRGDIYQERLFYSKQLYEKLVEITRNYIQSLGYSNSQVCLVSGGCSFCDHIVITLYNEAKLSNDPFHSLFIITPCLWNTTEKQYHTSSINHTGELLNRLHRTFSKRLLRNTLEEIDEIKKDPHVLFDDDNHSFESRNRKIAQHVKDVLIAFGWKESIDEVFNGGTKMTWNLSEKNCKNRKYFNILNPVI